MIECSENIKNDPYGEYRELPDGCRSFMRGLFSVCIMIVVMAIVFALLSMQGCSVQKPIAQQKDSIRIETKLDSVFIYRHDSIFRDRWRQGDTVFVTVEKWQTRWRDKTIEIHDTIQTNDMQTVQVKYIPNYYRNTSAGFWVLLVLIVIFIAIRIYKLYFKIKSL